MASDNFENALTSLLKPQEKSRLLKILVEIRKGVEGPNRRNNIVKLCDKGCLKRLITNLEQPHLDIVNITLSILGNCCMERTCARDAVKRYNLLPYLNHILKHFKHDSIQGRIFRIIGNMCQHWDRLADTVVEKESELQIVDRIVTFLKDVANSDGESSELSDSAKNKTSDATISMAIRALKELANGSTVVALIKQLGVLKAIGMILIKFTPKWQDTKQHEEILNAVLKLLYMYSKYYKNYDAIQELQTSDKGNAMIHLGKLVLLSPFIVVKITVNLRKISILKSDLPVGDISHALIERLQKPDSFPNGREDPLHRDYLKCVCLLMQQLAVKEEILGAGLIPTLILILQDYKDPTDVALKNSVLIIATLRYIFEDSSLIVMLKHGIIDVLFKKLNWILGPETDIDATHKYKSKKYTLHELRKRRRFLSDPQSESQLLVDIGCQYSKVRVSDICVMKERSLSPSSDTSVSSGPSFSPPSSPALSLSDTDAHAEDDDSDSDDYSPICSDAEGEHPPVTGITEESFPDAEEANEETNNEQTNFAESPVTHDKSAVSFKKVLANEIIKLIKLFTKIRPVAAELNNGDLLVKMLMFLLPENQSICQSDTLKVIMTITRTADYLIGLIQTDIIITAYRLTTIEHGRGCVICANLCTAGQNILKQFINLVEFGSGKGDIAHLLFRSSPTLKQKIVPAIPFLTDNKNTLSKLMINCSGLKIFMQLFQENSEMQQKLISGLYVMATKIGIKNPTSSIDEKIEHVIRLPIDVQHYKLEENCSTIVRFKLDDGTCVQADRDFLSQKSEYFNRLLSGTFKESWEEEIQLCNVPNKSLKFLLMLLQYDLRSTDIHKIDVELDMLLDVISLTDRYLMQDLCLCLTMSVQYFKFLPTTVPIIYKWSLESGTNILRVESVAYALVADINESERYDMFRSLLQLDYNEHLADDIQKLLTRFLCIVKKDC